MASRVAVSAASASFCGKARMITAKSVASVWRCTYLRACERRCSIPCKCRYDAALTRSYSCRSLRVPYQARSDYAICARNPRYDEDYVEVDEEDRWNNQAKRNVGLVPSLARPVLLAANSLADKLTNVACDVVPDTIERGTVEVAVKAGLVLIAVSIARSLLGVALTVGTVLFGIYVATKIWSKQDGPDPPGSAGRMQSKRQRRSSIQDDDGLSDVWFEKGAKRKSSTKKPEEPFW